MATGGCGHGRGGPGQWPLLVGREHGVGDVGVCVGDAVALVEKGLCCWGGVILE
jgi:hypothetical protein